MTDFTDTQAAAWDDIYPRFGNGPGSTLAAATPALNWLNNVIDQYQITSILDAPCGNWQWAQHLNLDTVTYTGWDIHAGQIEANQRQWPAHTFKQVNLITARRLPKVDLIICRDFLIHVPLDVAVRIVHKFAGAGRYLAVTTHPGADNQLELPADGHDNRPGYWCAGRDMEAPPFNLHRIDSVVEGQDGTTGKIGQEMILIDLA